MIENNINKMIIRHSAGNLYWKDTQGKYLGCNQTYSDMIGLSEPSDIIGKSDRDLYSAVMSDDKLKRIEEIDQNVITQGEEKIIEEEGVDGEGKAALYITKKIPLRNEKGKIIGLIGTSINITKEKQAEIAKNLFLQNMAHDIRTPFTGIYGILDLLYDTLDNSANKELVGYAKIAAKSLLDLLNQILEVINAGNQAVFKSKFNIRDLVNEVVNLMLAEAVRKDLIIKVNCPNEDIKSDRFRIYRIILNILGNAVKFTKKGAITLSVNVNSILKIEIQDTGIGIPEDKLKTIFDQFSKVNPSYKTGSYQGSGNGLYLSKMLAKELDGNITVVSKIDKGSIFTIEIRL